MKLNVTVEGMTCDGCANSVSKKFLGLDGVDRVLIDRENKTAAVETKRDITKEAFSQALKDSDYKVMEVTEVK